MAENNPFPGENNTGHFWDDNLRELNNPPPRWWMIGFWLSIAWWVLYSILYPTWLGRKTRGACRGAGYLVNPTATL
jgi:cytochrome c oxidase cbb3-type subunit 3